MAKSRHLESSIAPHFSKLPITQGSRNRRFEKALENFKTISQSRLKGRVGNCFQKFKIYLIERSKVFICSTGATRDLATHFKPKCLSLKLMFLQTICIYNSKLQLGKATRNSKTTKTTSKENEYWFEKPEGGGGGGCSIWLIKETWGKRLLV